MAEKELIFKAFQEVIPEILAEGFQDFIKHTDVMVLRDECIVIHGQDIDYDFKGWLYYLYSLENLAHMVYVRAKFKNLSLLGKYTDEEFKQLFRKDLMEMIEKKVEEIQDKIKEHIKFEIYKKTKDFLAKNIKTRHRIYNIIGWGRIINDSLSLRNPEEYIIEVANNIAESSVEGNSYIVLRYYEFPRGEPL